MKNLIFIFLTCLAIGCYQTSQNNVLQVDEFSKQISNPNIQLIDVRTAQEFSEGYIANALNIDYKSNDFDQTCMSLLDLNKPVYVYCLSGGRSSSAAQALKSMGFTQVYDLKGGISAWKEANKPIVVHEKPVVDANNSIQVSDDDANIFASVIKGKKLVLVDFNAVWCKPCKMMEPDVMKIKAEQKEIVEVLSIDVDKHPDIAAKYNITAMPTLIYFKNNEILEQSVGMQSYDELMKMVMKHK